MKTRILDGRIAADKILRALKTRVSKLSRQPVLATVLVGRRPDSVLYIRMKQRAAARVGIRSRAVQLPSSVSQATLIRKIQALNQTRNVTGILLQLPLPSHLEPGSVIKHIDRKKDVDGLRLDSSFASPFLQSLLHLTKLGNPGRGSAIILAQPSPIRTELAAALKKRGFRVAADPGLHRLPATTKTARLIITFRGRGPRLSTATVGSNTIIVDGGIRQRENKTVGDADPSVLGHAKALSPVPGGVGPLTVAYLIANTLSAAKKK